MKLIYSLGTMNVCTNTMVMHIIVVIFLIFVVEKSCRPTNYRRPNNSIAWPCTGRLSSCFSLSSQAASTRGNHMLSNCKAVLASQLWYHSDGLSFAIQLALQNLYVILAELTDVVSVHNSFATGHVPCAWCPLVGAAQLDSIGQLGRWYLFVLPRLLNYFALHTDGPTLPAPVFSTLFVIVPYKMFYW